MIMRRLSTHLVVIALILFGSALATNAGVNTWTGVGPLATGFGNRSINAFAVSADGRTVYAGTGSGTVFVNSVTPSYLLTISIPPVGLGIGSGEVTSDTGGIDCLTGNSNVCTATYLEGTVLTLTASTASNSTFTSWSNDCTGMAPCLLAMTTNKNVTAQFGLG